MGMYTELKFGAYLKEDKFPEIYETLDCLVDGWELPPTKIPDHEFFRTPRHTMLFRGTSAYFITGGSRLRPHDPSLHVSSSLKNYDDEIDKFLDWIGPYVVGQDEMVGYYRYEESFFPTLLYVDGGKIVEIEVSKMIGRDL